MKNKKFVWVTGEVSPLVEFINKLRCNNIKENFDLDKGEPVTLVFWSGGRDSTFLIQHLLENNPKLIVWASYIEMINNADKTRAELDAIRKMLPIFSQKYKDRFKFLGICYRVEVNYISHRTDLLQSPLLLSAIMTSTPYRTNEIAIGYVKDDEVLILNEYQTILKSFNSICQVPLPKLSFPLLKWTKKQIFRTIDPKLKKYVMSCETPRETKNGFKHCYKCDACKESCFR